MGLLEQKIFEAHMFAAEWERHGWHGEPMSLEMWGSFKVFSRGRDREDDQEGFFTEERGSYWINYRNRDWWDARWRTFGQRRQIRLMQDLRRDARKGRSGAIRRLAEMGETY